MKLQATYTRIIDVKGYTKTKMATARTYFNPDPESEDSSSSEEDEDNSERMTNIFSKWRKIQLANASDTYVFVGIDSPRELKTGGEKYKIGFPGVVGLEIKRGGKEHEVISRIPWLKSQPHR